MSHRPFGHLIQRANDRFQIAGTAPRRHYERNTSTGSVDLPEVHRRAIRDVRPSSFNDMTTGWRFRAFIVTCSVVERVGSSMSDIKVNCGSLSLLLFTAGKCFLYITTKQLLDET